MPTFAPVDPFTPRIAKEPPVTAATYTSPSERGAGPPMIAEYETETSAVTEPCKPVGPVRVFAPEPEPVKMFGVGVGLGDTDAR